MDQPTQTPNAAPAETTKTQLQTPQKPAEVTANPPTASGGNTIPGGVAAKPAKKPSHGLKLFAKKEKPKTTQGASSLKKMLGGLSTIGLGKEKTRFIENIAILLNSGLSVIDALKTIHTEIRLKPMKKLVARIIDQVESGIPLWMAMEEQNFFSMYSLALIRIGEESGSLSRNMEYLAIQQEKDRSLRSKVKMAMIYPTIVVSLTVIITLGLAWFVLPQLVGVLLALNADLPLVTRIIIWIANFFRDHGSVAVPLTLGAMLLISLLCKYTSLRGPTQEIIFLLPGIGTMAKAATIARFGIILGSLLKAGVPLVESIRSTADVTDVVSHKKFYTRLGQEIEVGQSFAAAFQNIKQTGHLLPASVQQLIITGEKSGKIAEMLLRVAEIYERKAEDAAARLPVVLEPLLLIFIGGLVGTIAFAIIVPIYSIVGNVGR